jgi:hypothetical protein
MKIRTGAKVSKVGNINEKVGKVGIKAGIKVGKVSAKVGKVGNINEKVGKVGNINEKVGKVGKRARFHSYLSCLSDF